MLYLFITFIIIPPIAKKTGRVHLDRSKSGILVPHNYLTVILNRNYVTADMLKSLNLVSTSLRTKDPSIKISYLDACFPFFDGFPLLPHLSHNDGKKIDLSFYYRKNNQATNKKPSRLGYGVFASPKDEEVHYTKICKKKNQFYDFSKYLTLGSKSGFYFDEYRTKELINSLLKAPQTHKIFLEPHLKTRMNLVHDKLRFQGCHSVRHDDHIHYQIY